jgi:predicted DNA-binding ribbon-helix-helix protein
MMSGINLMIRTQIQFTQEQWEALKKLANARHVSVAELVRQSVDKLIRSPENMSFDEYQQLCVEIVGKYQSGMADVSANHDKYLSETYNP